MKKLFVMFLVMPYCACFAQVIQPWNLNRDYGLPDDISGILEAASSRQLEDIPEADQNLLLANKRARVLKNHDNPLWYDEFVIACLLNIIKKYPTSRVALTAKLYLATAYIQTFAPDPNNFKLTESDQKAHKVFASIAEQHPEEWEGLSARYYLEGIQVLFGNNPESARKKIENLIPLAEKIEAEASEKMEWYKKYIVDFDKPFDLGIYDLLCHYAKEKGDKELYESMKKKILERYPKSHSARFLQKGKKLP